MSNQLARQRWSRTMLAVIGSTAIAIAIAVGFGSPAGATAPAQPGCSAGVTPVSYQGQSYCPGTAIGVKNTSYGTGKRIVLTGVSVTRIQGTRATVASTITTACPPNKYCGALVTTTTITVSLAGLSAWPAVGSYGDLYGITSTGSLTVTGFVDRSSSGTCTNSDYC